MGDAQKRVLRITMIVETDWGDARLGEQMKEFAWKLTRGVRNGRMICGAESLHDEDAQTFWEAAGLGPEPKSDAVNWKPKS